MKNLIRRSSALWAILITVAGVSEAVHASQQQLLTFFADVRKFSADFEQRVVDSQGSTLDVSRGKMYLSRPGKFRWDYFEDSLGGSAELTQQLVSDGRSIFHYDIGLEQVTKRNFAEAINQVPSLILVDDGTALEQHFTLEELPNMDGLSWVQLKPSSSDSNFHSMLIAFSLNKKNVLPQRVMLFDAIGNETNLIFSDTKANQSLSGKLFNFVAPAGVDVLTQ